MLIIRAKRASYRLREVIIQSETINAPNRRKLVFVRIGAFFIDGGDLCAEHAVIASSLAAGVLVRIDIDRCFQGLCRNDLR